MDCERVNACVVIPVFNNVRTVGAVVLGARRYAKTVLVLDDGSSDGSGDAAEQAGAQVLRHQTNQGKGVALQALLVEAGRRGFRYALSMDADGQHFPDDLPRFLAEIATVPGAFVMGARDLVAAGAPGSSEFGRKFSNFWVWLETGVRVDDSQSGFRAYPLPETLQLGARQRRYELEADLLLRAAWAGLPLRTVPIRVSYPPDRVTHFRLFRDNVRIVLVNTWACLRMPWPLPLGKRLRPLPHRPGLSLFALRRWAWLGGEGPLWRGLAALLGVLAARGVVSASWTRGSPWVAAVLGLGAVPAWLARTLLPWATARAGSPGRGAALLVGLAVLVGALEQARAPKRSPAQWTGKSRGGVFGHWFFFQVTRYLGVGAAYAIVYPVSLYFLFALRSQRAASRAFLDRALGPAAGLRGWLRTYRHFLIFAQTMVDRAVIAVHGKEAFQAEPNGLHHIRDAAAANQGAILLTAHVGNWEIAAGLLDGAAHDKLTVVAFRGEEERLRRYLEKAQGAQPRVLDVGKELASLEMIRALRAGDVLAIHGDRAIDANVVRIPFLGKEAPFPVGPFVLAAVSGAPLIATFSQHVGMARYRFFACPPQRLAFTPGQSRDEQLRGWVQGYVRLLEEALARDPYQWFNFYDFWDAPPSPLPVRTSESELPLERRSA